MKRLRALLALAGGWLVIAGYLVATIVWPDPVGRRKDRPWTP